MRKIIFAMVLIASMLSSAATWAQTQEPYNKVYKYSFFSNWSVGAAGVSTKTTDFSNWTVGDGISFGAELRATKRIGTVWNLRYLAEVPGFITKTNQETGTQFDRYGKIMSGISLDIIPNLYVFADAGMTWNQSTSVRMVGIAGQAGLGSKVYFGKRSNIFLELGADYYNNHTFAEPLPNDFRNWESNLFAKLGYSVNLGITARDKINLSNLREMPEKIKELEKENHTLEHERLQCESTNNDLSQTLNRMSSAIDRLSKELSDCRESKKELEKTAEIQIFFEYGSYELLDSELRKLDSVSELIKSSNDEYSIDGYSSVPGTDDVNRQLSIKRANAVYNKLIDLGAGDRISGVSGHGKTEMFGQTSNNQTVIVRPNKQ